MTMPLFCLFLDAMEQALPTRIIVLLSSEPSNTLSFNIY